MNKQRHDLLYLRQTNNLNYNIVDVKLDDDKSIRQIEYEFLLHSYYVLEKSLHAYIKEHYCAYSLAYWRFFLKYWLPKLTNCVIIYTSRLLEPTLFSNNKNNNIIILGIMFYMEKPRLHDIYVRLLCSNSYCGGKLLNYVKTKYSYSEAFDRISLNSEPKSLNFYKKHGFTMTNKYYQDIYGIKYPYMVKSTGSKLILDKDEQVFVGGYWPGIAYYIYKYWFYILLVGIIGLVIYTLMGI